MKNKLLKMLIVGLAVCSLFSISGMLTQDEGAAFGTEVDRLIALGVSKEPTCTADGEKTFKCSLCGDSYAEIIAAKGHTDGQFTVTTEPTCTEPGEKTIYCSVCSEPIRTETIEATGHENTYINTVNPGFFTPGREEVTCMKCYEVLETKEIPVPM